MTRKQNNVTMSVKLTPALRDTLDRILDPNKGESISGFAKSAIVEKLERMGIEIYENGEESLTI
jgi:hypothetical protein